MCFEIGADRYLLPFAVDEKDPPIPIDLLTFGNSQAVFALKRRVLMFIVARIDAGGKVVDDGVSPVPIRNPHLDPILRKAVVIYGPFRARVARGDAFVFEDTVIVSLIQVRGS